MLNLKRNIIKRGFRETPLKPMEYTMEGKEIIDIDELRNNIKNIKSELVEVEAQLEKYLEELGLGV